MSAPWAIPPRPRARWAFPSCESAHSLCIICGSVLGGIGGAYLSLFYPGSWTEAISSGQGLMAVALVIFARWNPVQCLWASLLFGGAQALGPSLQAVGISSWLLSLERLALLS